MKTRSGEKIKLMSVDELLGVSEGEPVSEIEIRKIYEFKKKYLQKHYFIIILILIILIRIISNRIISQIINK